MTYDIYLRAVNGHTFKYKFKTLRDAIIWADEVHKKNILHKGPWESINIMEMNTNNYGASILAFPIRHDIARKLCDLPQYPEQVIKSIPAWVEMINPEDGKFYIAGAKQIPNP